MRSEWHEEENEFKYISTRYYCIHRMEWCSSVSYKQIRLFQEFHLT